MRVLSFSYCFPNHAQPNWGVFVFQRLAAAAARCSLQVASPVPTFPLVTRLRGQPGPLVEEWQGLTVHRPRFFYLPGVMKHWDGPLYARGLKRWFDKLVQRWQPDVLDAHFEWPDAVGVGLLARRCGLPYVVTLRGWLYEAMGQAKILPQCLDAIAGAAGIIGVSDDLVRTAVKLGAPADRTHVIANGVDRTRFTPRDKLQARRELGLPEQGPLLVSVAHLGPRKGHRETVQSLAGLPSDVKLVLVGGDPHGGRSCRELTALIRQRNLEGRVIFAGRQPYAKIPLYFNAADVSVLASYREGCPNVVLESLASGTPVVASDVGNVMSLIDDGRDGRIVPARTVEPLAAAIEEMLRKQPSPEVVCNSPAVRSWDEVAGDVCSVLRRAASPGESNGGMQPFRNSTGPAAQSRQDNSPVASRV